MFKFITYLCDRVRISLRDSQCSLSGKCPEYDSNNDTCASYRGRTETRGSRAECYFMFKSQIRAQKEDLASKAAGAVVEGIMEAEGIDDD